MKNRVQQAEWISRGMRGSRNLAEDLKSMSCPYTNVFIVGCPRSGKTLLQSMLGHHGAFAWFSQFHLRRCGVLAGWANRIYDLPWLGVFLSRCDEHGSILPTPAEMPKTFTEALTAMGSLDHHDLSDGDYNTLKAIFTDQLRYQNKSIFLTDCGRPARLLYFRAVFPRSRFIHVIRDGRDVAAAFIRERPQWVEDWLAANKDLRYIENTVSESLNQMLVKHRGTAVYPAVFVALRWKLAITEIEKQRECLRDIEYLCIRYEDMVSDRFDVIDRILRFLGLPWTTRLTTVVSGKTVGRPSVGWEEYFGNREVSVLDELIGDILARYGYPART